MPLPAFLAAAAPYAIPAVASGLGSLFSYLGSKQPQGQTQQLPTLNPQQISAQNQALQMALAGLRNRQTGVPQPNYSGFDPIAQRATTQFQTQTVPSLAERFTSMGSNRGSSAFEGALGQAGAGLQENLAALRSQYGLGQQQLGLQSQGQELGILQALLGAGLQPNFQSLYQNTGPGFLGSLGSSLLGVAPSLFGNAFGQSTQMGQGNFGGASLGGLGSFQQNAQGGLAGLSQFSPFQQFVPHYSQYLTGLGGQPSQGVL